MVSTFQEWWFQRWRQASLWTTKKIRRQWIGGITRWRSELNARGACRYIGSNSTTSFRTIKIHGNDSKARQLGSMTWQSYSFARQRSASCRKSRKRIFGNAQVRYSTAPAVFSRHCSFWLLVVPTDAARFGRSPVHFFRRNWKLARNLDRLKKRDILLRWN